MKKIMILMLLMVSMSTYAQSSQKEKMYYYYCILSYELKWGDYYGNLLSDDDYKICDENNSPISFKNNMQILNYMSKLGWEFVSEDASSFIIRKMVNNDEEVKSGLNLLTSKEVKKAKKEK